MNEYYENEFTLILSKLRKFRYRSKVPIIWIMWISPKNVLIYTDYIHIYLQIIFLSDNIQIIH